MIGPMRVWLVASVAVVVSVAGAPARADLASPLASGGEVDWTRGVVTATGIGLADRHAPSPAVGRAASRRRADDDARKRLGVALAEVPWVDAGTPAELATRDGWLEAHAVTVFTGNDEPSCQRPDAQSV